MRKASRILFIVTAILCFIACLDLLSTGIILLLSHNAVREAIERLDEILLLVRASVGWTAQEFGDKIGVTRQTINNLETHRRNTHLTKIQYIAIRSVLDEEIETHKKDTEMLRTILDAFVDRPEKYTDEARMEMYKKARMLSPAIMNGSCSRKEISDEWKTVLLALGIVIAPPIAAATIGYWKKKL